MVESFKYKVMFSSARDILLLPPPVSVLVLSSVAVAKIPNLIEQPQGVSTLASLLKKCFQVVPVLHIFIRCMLAFIRYNDHM